MAAAMTMEAIDKAWMDAIHPRRWSKVVGAVLVLLLAGCGSSKVAQCNELADVVNQTQGFMQEFETEIQTFSKSAAQVKNLEDIKSAASQYTTAVDKVVTNLDGLTSDLQSTDLKDDSLIQFRDSYVEVVQGFSKALKEARSAMDLVVTVESEAELPAKIEESQQQTLTAVESIEKLSQTESQLISEVNTYCGAPQPSESASPAPAPTP
jgi:Sec-independent protein translocase protein TatA